jgi:hypothetical protein
LRDFGRNVVTFEILNFFYVLLDVVEATIKVFDLFYEVSVVFELTKVHD